MDGPQWESGYSRIMLMFRRNTCYVLIDSYSVKHMQLYRAIHMYRVVCLSLGRNIADVTDSLTPQPVFRPHRMHRVQRCSLLLQVHVVSVLWSQRWAVLKRLKQLRCCLECGLGWAQGTVYLFEPVSPHEKRQFWGIFWPIVKYQEYPVCSKVVCWVVAVVRPVAVSCAATC